MATAQYKIDKKENTKQLKFLSNSEILEILWSPMPSPSLYATDLLLWTKDNCTAKPFIIMSL